MVEFRKISSPALASRRGPLAELVSDLVAYAGKGAVVTGLLLLLGALLEGFGLLLLLPILGVALGSASGEEWLGGFTSWLLALAPGASRFEQLLLLLGLFAAVLAVRAAVILARDVTLAKLQVGFVESHRLQIIRLLSNTRWDVVSRLRHGRITHVLGGDVQACGDAVSMLLQSTVAATMLAGQAVLVLLLSPALALLVFPLLIGGAFTLRPVIERSRRLGAALTEANLGLVTGTTQFLGGLKLALSQNLQQSFFRGFQAMLAEAAAYRVAFIRQRTGTQLWLTAAAAFVAGSTILIGIGWLGTAPSTLIAFLFVLARMNGPAAQLQAGAQQIFHSLPAYGKIKQLEAELGTAQEHDDPSPPAALAAGDVEFRDVSFWHGEERSGGLFGISLIIPQGVFIGLTGPSGAGKTTFADLLVGLYPPKSGTVTVGGMPLQGRALAAWRAEVSYVSQDPFLFHDSIRENLLWARPEADEEAIWAALRAAGAEQLVRGMAGQLETVVGERGALLSGGERQRIALARALIRTPRLLVLDEATNAIDVDGERAILQRLVAAPSRPTIVMIAHRQSSLDLCASLLELQNGRIVSHS